MLVGTEILQSSGPLAYCNRPFPLTSVTQWAPMFGPADPQSRTSIGCNVIDQKTRPRYPKNKRAYFYPLSQQHYVNIRIDEIRVVDVIGSPDQIRYSGRLGNIMAGSRNLARRNGRADRNLTPPLQDFPS